MVRPASTWARFCQTLFPISICLRRRRRHRLQAVQPAGRVAMGMAMGMCMAGMCAMDQVRDCMPVIIKDPGLDKVLVLGVGQAAVAGWPDGWLLHPHLGSRSTAEQRQSSCSTPSTPNSTPFGVPGAQSLLPTWRPSSKGSYTPNDDMNSTLNSFFRRLCFFQS